MADIYPNLPGVRADIKDGGLRVQPPPTVLTQSVLLMGTATDGPKNVPYSVTGIHAIESVFGQVNRSTDVRNLRTSLVRALFECYGAGCTDIRLIRVLGDEATIDLLDGESAAAVTLRSAYPGTKYNALKAEVAVTAGAPTITITKTDGTTQDLAFDATDTYGEIVNTINRSTSATYVNATTTDESGTQGLAVMAETSFESGTDGVPSEYATTTAFASAYQNALCTTLALLEGIDVNVIVPLGAYLDPDSGDANRFAQNMATYCYRSAAQENDVVVVMTTSPLNNPTLANISTRADSIAAFDLNLTVKNGYITTTSPSSAADDVLTDGATIDIGKYVSILGGPEAIFNSNRLGNYINTAEAAYAGLISKLAVHSAPTNKVVPGILGLGYEFGQKQHNDIAGNRVVSLRNKQAGTCVVSAMTFAPTTSDFTRLSTMRISNSVIGLVRRIADPFIGEGSTEEMRNSLGSAIQSGLDAMKDNGILQNFNFQLTSTAIDQVRGDIWVYITIVPAFEVRNIRLVLRLRPEL